MHSVLAAAIDAAPPQSRPTTPAHRGVDANPQLASFGFCGVALFVADAIANQVPAKEEKRFTDWVTQARDLYDRHSRAEGSLVKKWTRPRRKVLTKEANKKLELLLRAGQPFITVTPGLSTALSAANVALLAAYDVEETFGGSMVATGVRTVVARVVRELPPTQVKSFLLELDERLLREELRAVLALRNDPTAARVTACIWRAASGKAREGRAAGAKVTHWLGTLDDGSYLLIWKVGSRWQVSTGPREDVLATVPNEHMASALAAATPSSAPSPTYRAAKRPG